MNQKAVILLDVLKVICAYLGQDGIYETASFFTGFADQLSVRRGHHYYGQDAYVGRNFLAGFVVPPEFLFPRGRNLNCKAGYQSVIHCVSAC